MSQLKIIVLVALAFAAPTYAATSSSVPPHEIYGFMLEQNQAAFDATLGKPFNTGKTPQGLSYRAYAVPGSKASYLVAMFTKDRVVTLELTGTDYSGPTGFLGLTLGQEASAVEAIVGKPAEIRHEADDNVDLWDYKLDNYTLEFTPGHKLYSIQVTEDPLRQIGLPVGSSEVRRYGLALQASDVDTMIQMSSGSLVCTNAAEFGFSRAARTDLADAEGKLSACLRKAGEAIVSLGPNMAGADDQLRLAPEVHKSFCVTKFPETSPLREVVFTWEVNAWRVYEVTFR